MQFEERRAASNPAQWSVWHLLCVCVKQVVMWLCRCESSSCRRTCETWELPVAEQQASKFTRHLLTTFMTACVFSGLDYSLLNHNYETGCQVVLELITKRSFKMAPACCMENNMKSIQKLLYFSFSQNNLTSCLRLSALNRLVPTEDLTNLYVHV